MFSYLCKAPEYISYNCPKQDMHINKSQWSVGAICIQRVTDGFGGKCNMHL